MNSQKLPSRLFYKNIDNQRQFILLPIYQPTEIENSATTEKPINSAPDNPGSVTAPTGTSGYNTEFLTTESAFTSQRHHPDDARQVPDVGNHQYDNAPEAIYPGLPKIPVTQFGGSGNPDFPVEMDPEEPVGHTGYPDTGPGSPGTAPGYPNSAPGTPDTSFGYPNTAPGYPDNNPGYPNSEFPPRQPPTNPGILTPTGFPDTGPGSPGTAPGYPNTGPGYPDNAPGYPHSEFPPRQPPTNPGILTPDFGILPEFPSVFEEFPVSEPSPRQCLIRTCTQIVSGRNLAYGRALQIVQSEEYLEAADLDAIRRIRRYKRSTLEDDTRTIVINDMLDFNSTFTLDTLAKTGLAGFLFGLLYLTGNKQSIDLPGIPGIPDTFNSIIPTPRPNNRKPRKRNKKKKPEKLVGPGQVPPDQPQPGTPGGGRLPLDTNDPVIQQALSLVPPGATPVSVFPPYAKERTFSSISVIFSEPSLPQYKPKYRRYKRRKPKYNVQENKYGFKTVVFLVSGEPCIANINCDSEGYKLAQPRIGQSGAEDFVSEAPVECRAEIDPNNQACLQQYY